MRAGVSRALPLLEPLERRVLLDGVSPLPAEPLVLDEAVSVVVAGERGVQLEIGRFLSGRAFEASASADGGDVVDVTLPVRLSVFDSTDVRLRLGDVFSDNGFDLEGGNLIRIHMPIDIEVLYSDRVTVEAEDFFSDNTFTWSGGSGNVRIEMPVSITVVGSQDVIVNVEDVFGDASFAWRMEVTGSAGMRSAPTPRGVFDLVMPIGFNIDRSSRVLVDVEDLVGDNMWRWEGAGAALGPGSSGEAAGFRLMADMPLNLSVHRSLQSEIDVEDVFGDNDFRWDIAPPPEVAEGGRYGIGGGFDVRGTSRFEIWQSTDVLIDVEDTFGDSDFRWRGGAGGAGRAADRGAMFRFQAPQTFGVYAGSQAEINVEDVGGDNDWSWTADEAAGQPAPLLFTAPVSYEVTDSVEVSIDTEDFVGDNDLSRRGSEAPSRPGPKDVPRPVFIDAGLSVGVWFGERVSVDVEDVFGNNNLLDRLAGVRADRAAGVASGAVSVPVSVVQPVRLLIDGGRSNVVEAATVFGGNTFRYGEAERAVPLAALSRVVLPGTRERAASESSRIGFGRSGVGNRVLV